MALAESDVTRLAIIEPLPPNRLPDFVIPACNAVLEPGNVRSIDVVTADLLDGWPDWYYEVDRTAHDPLAVDGTCIIGTNTLTEGAFGLATTTDWPASGLFTADHTSGWFTVTGNTNYGIGAIGTDECYEVRLWRVAASSDIGSGFVNVPEAYPLVDYETVEYTLRYWGPDSFRLTCGGGSKNATKLKPGNFLWMPDEGDLLFLIESVETDKDGASMVDSEVIALGRSFEGIALNDRIVLPIYPAAYDVQTAVPAETAMKHYVDFHAGPSAPAERQIPHLAIAADLGRGADVSVSGRFQKLYAILHQIGLKSGLGWAVRFNPATGALVFDILVGVDQSSDVFFSFTTSTIDSWDDLVSYLDAVTLAYVAGAGPGSLRDLVTRWNGPAEPTGLARREKLVVATDVRAGDTDTLELRGDAVLAASPVQRMNEIVTSVDAPFVFGVDYGLGDFVLLEDDETGIREPVRVTAITKIYDESGGAPRVLPQLGQPFPTIPGRVSGPAPGGGSTDTGTILDGTVTLASLSPEVLALLGVGGELIIADGSADFLTTEDGLAFLVTDP